MNHSYLGIDSPIGFYNSLCYTIQSSSPVMAHKRPTITWYSYIPLNIYITFYRYHRRSKPHITYKYLRWYSITKFIYYRYLYTIGCILFYYKVWTNSDVYDQADDTQHGQRLCLLTACRLVGLFLP